MIGIKIKQTGKNNIKKKPINGINSFEIPVMYYCKH